MNAAMVTAAATEKPSVHIHRRLINFHSLNIIFGSFSSAWKIMYETLRQTMATSLCMCGVCVCVPRKIDRIHFPPFIAAFR